MRPVDGIAKRKVLDTFAELIKNEQDTVIKRGFKHRSRLSLPKMALIVAAIAIVAATTTVADDVWELSRLASLLSNGRYLVLFQNNAELRPTGGFLGSFGVVNTAGGKIQSFHVEGNIYKADNEFIKTYKISAPEPFQKIWPNSFMALNSANWSPDFSTAAQAINWYYAKEYGDTTIDGVIAVNSTAVAELVKLVGPIELPQYNLTFTPENFLTALQKYVEKDYYESLENQQRNEPKSIINDLAQVILTKTKEVSPLRLFDLSRQWVDTHEMQFWFRDQSKQILAEKSGWSFELPQWDGNYLYINNANLGGGKGSLQVSQTANYESKSNSDGSQEVLLRITRANLGRQDYPVSDNLNYTRVFVPLGSSLNYIYLDGIDILDQTKADTELQMTWFGFWFDTAIGQKKEAIISYHVPPLKTPKLMLDHQPGAPVDQIELKFDGRKAFVGELLKRRIFDIVL